MAGGPFAAVMCCMKCGRRAERLEEGVENDTYRCSAGHGYSVHWKQMPKSPAWPPSAAERAQLEAIAKALGWDLAEIDAEIARWAPSPAPPSRPQHPIAAPRSASAAARPHRHEPAKTIDTVHDAREWVEGELRRMSSGWSNAKRDHAGDDWDDFAHYKANERASNELLRAFVAFEPGAFAGVTELADALESLVDRVHGDADYGSPAASLDAVRALVATLRAPRAR